MNASPATTAPPAEQVIQGQPPPATLVEQHASHGSVGAVVGVVMVIAVLGIIAAVIGRLCGRRNVMGYGGHFDIEEWAETKCSSCIDGHVGPPPPPRTTEGSGAASVAPTPAVTGEARTEEERESE